MAVQALVDAFLYGDSKDFTVDTNTITFEGGAESKDATTFASGGWTEVVGGLKSGSMNMAGFWQAGTGQVDPIAWANLGTADKLLTFGPTDTEGEPAYMLNSQESKYELFGAVGELVPFNIDAQLSAGNYGVVRGKLAKAKGNVSATGVLGSVVELTAVSSGQYVYAGVHIFTAGTTITIKVQSDSASGFPSPTDVATIGPLTMTGGTFMTRVAGPITDSFFRMSVSAITGTFSVAGAIAVQ